MAFFTPADMGENNTSNVQISGCGNVCPEQMSFSMLNSELPVPVIERVSIARSSMPPEVTVKVRLLDEPTVTAAGISNL